MPNMLHFGAIFSCIPIFRPSIAYPFLPPPYLRLPSRSHATLPLLFPKDVNKKLSYRRQNALSITETQKAIPSANTYYFYAYASLDSSSFLACNSRLRSAIRQHHPQQRAVLIQICCFGERKVVLFQILSDGAEPSDAGTT